MPLLFPAPISQTKPPPGAVLDWNHPLTQGLVGDWLLNDKAGEWVYDTTGVNHGVFWKSSGTPVWHDEGLVTTGTDHATTHPAHPSLRIVQDVSMEARFRFTSLPAGDHVVAINGHDDPGGGWGFGLVQNGSGLYIYSFTGGNAVNQIATLTAGVDYHAVIVRQGARQEGWVRSVEGLETGVKTDVGTGELRWDNGFNIGGLQPYGGVTVDALIYHVRLWNRALQFDEAEQLFNDPYGLYLPPPSDSWRRAWVFDAIAAEPPAEYTPRLSLLGVG